MKEARGDGAAASARWEASGDGHDFLHRLRRLLLRLDDGKVGGGVGMERGLEYRARLGWEAADNCQGPRPPVAQMAGVARVFAEWQTKSRETILPARLY